MNKNSSKFSNKGKNSVFTDPYNGLNINKATDPINSIEGKYKEQHKSDSGSNRATQTFLNSKNGISYIGTESYKKRSFLSNSDRYGNEDFKKHFPLSDSNDINPPKHKTPTLKKTDFFESKGVNDSVILDLCSEDDYKVYSNTPSFGGFSISHQNNVEVSSGEKSTISTIPSNSSKYGSISVDISSSSDDEPTISCRDTPSMLFPPSVGSKMERYGFSTSNTSQNNANIIVSIIEGNGTASEVGMCTLNTDTKECFLSQYADYGGFSKTLYNIDIYKANKIIISQNSILKKKSKIYDRIINTVPSSVISSVPRSYFNEEKGIKFVKVYFFLNSNYKILHIHHPGIEAIKNWVSQDDEAIIMLVIQSKYYCLSALGALFEFAEKNNLLEFRSKCIKTSFGNNNSTIYMDSTTCKELELIESLSKPGSQYSLFGAINQTKTAMGNRVLRLNILQPPTDLTTINGRLDAVDSILSSENIFFGIQTELNNLPDIDSVINNVRLFLTSIQ
ncbi:MutS protein-like protein [Smittium mucronatum]|uniref:MutS protein-like protein n=1 Tax=Smittium mucronatum TaxID=133383 RepID=A0A1R0GQA4_9FUNG|nr:MutS protein-like protein [Smittium mucronatum]